MPRRKKTDTPDTAPSDESTAATGGRPDARDVFDEVIEAAGSSGVAAQPTSDITRSPSGRPEPDERDGGGDSPRGDPDRRQPAATHDGASGPRRALRHTTTVSVGDDRVHIVDEGHSIGIQLDLADRDAVPSNAVKEILKAAMHGRRGLDYRPMRGEKPWVKPVSDNPVGDRLDNEKRHADVVAQHRKDRGFER